MHESGDEMQVESHDHDLRDEPRLCVQWPLACSYSLTWGAHFIG